MKKVIFVAFLAIVFSVTSLRSQNASWAWADHSGGQYYELTEGIASDHNGYMIVTGSFSSPSIMMGNVQLTNNSLSNMSDMYIAKYDPAGNVVWARSFGGALSEYSMDVATDAGGNIFVTGTFTSDPFVLGTSTLQCTDPWGDSSDIFTAVFDPAGNPIWARSASGNGVDEANKIAVDAQGSVYVTGEFNSDIIYFGTQSIINQVPGNSYDAYLVKYDALGNTEWVRAIAGSDYEWSGGIAVDQNGNVLITGSTGSDSIVTTAGILHNASSSGLSDVFVAKYNSSGTMLWSRMFGGSSSEGTSDLDTDPAGSIFVCGTSYSVAFIFGSDSFTNYSPWGTDGFLAKFDAMGNPMWLSEVRGDNYEGPGTVCCDNAWNIFVGGSYGSPVTYFGTDSLLNSYPGYGEIFVAQYDQAGTVIALLSAGGSGGEGVGDIACDGVGGVYAVGSYNSIACQFGSTYLPFSGFYDQFVAKWSVTWTTVPYVDAIQEPELFPNPFTDFLHVFIEDAGDATGELYTIDGQHVMSFRLNQGDNVISTSTLAEGMYCMVLRSNQGVSTRRIVKCSQSD